MRRRTHAESRGDPTAANASKRARMQRKGAREAPSASRSTSKHASDGIGWTTRMPNAATGKEIERDPKLTQRLDQCRCGTSMRARLPSGLSRRV